ncbi:quinone oxidoreductase family protein [Marinivivus vitaminiproducens]|uniref:quinone oxidoreductase family protein n=1 Tax=Marinivivus vitaminiproducens TaxID=3035935 RepID=UPI00279A2C30|nr:zinc-binding dehydrogenase [Geminicoccaceae bacterium SCSIO 64248]
MRAVIIRSPGPDARLEIVEHPDPEAGPGEVLVRVGFAGCNFADTMLRRGTYPHPVSYPMIPGVELAGTIVALGEGVSGLAEGQRIAAFAEGGGGYAELRVLPAEDVIPLPDEVGLEQGAGFPVQGLTAYHMLHTIGRIERGQNVLVNAIGGGVGLWTTQLAVAAGAHVFGTTGSAGKDGKPLALGAKAVIRRDREDFVARLDELTEGQGIDLAIDSLGAETLDRSFAAMRKLGHVISIGEAEGLPYTNIRERLLPKSLTFTRFHLGHVERGTATAEAGIDHVLGGIADGAYRAPIERIFPLDEAQAMHDALESRTVAGKLLLRMPD